MNLNDRDWAEFQVGDIFKLQRGHTLTVEQKEEYEGDIPCINGTIENNGVQCKLSRNIETIGFNIVKAPAISIVRVGNGGKTFVQTEDFYIADNAFALTPLICMSVFSMMFISTILDSEQLKYSYGRTVTNDYSNTVIKLPVDADGNPDWQFMEDYIKSLHHKPLTTKNKSGQVPALNVQGWGEFRVGDLFRLESTKGIVTDDLMEGFDVPYMAAKHDGNGIEMMCSKDGVEDWISEGNCIVFINLGAGSAGYANYIKEDFIGMSGKTTCGYNSHLNEWNGLFITTCLCQERPKYSFGRSWTGDRLKDTIIKLPIDANGNPDWQFMEDYIKSLPYGDRLEG